MSVNDFMASGSSFSGRANINKENPLVHHVHDNFDFEQSETQSPPQRETLDSFSVTPLTKSLNHSILRPVTHESSRHSPIAAFFNSNFDEHGYVFDGVKIEIEDIDNTSVSNTTTQSLKRCKRQVLRHYYNLLCFIGWRPFFKERYYKTPCLGTFINILYPLLIISLLVYSYVYDTITCQYKLNVLKDTEIIPAKTLRPAFTKTTTANLTSADVIPTTPSIYDDVLILKQHPTWSAWHPLHSTSKTPLAQPPKEADVCGHILTTYIVPSAMHLLAYIIGFFYFRIMESEQLYALMEKVFLAVNQTMKVVQQDKVIRRLKMFLFFGTFWVILAMASQILYRIAFGMEDLLQPWLPFIIVQSVALIIVNSVYLAVVINHATQVEMILFYVHEVKTRLEEKSITLKDAYTQILELRMAIGSLNSTVSKMSSLVVLIFIVKFTIGLIILIMTQSTDPFVWAYRSIFLFSWFIILVFTVIQVIRINSKCSKFKKIAIAARVYGYHNATRDELDSFVLFISNVKLRVKLLGVPLKASPVVGLLILAAFILVVLFQSSVFTSPSSFI